MDSSALVKRYLSEKGSIWVAAQTDTLAANTIVIAEITCVEVAAALAARHRSSPQYAISRDDRDRLFRLFARHLTNEYRAMPVTSAITDRAMHLTQTYRLRGYDAVQLASGLAAVAALPDLQFVASDADLLAAALAEGMPCANPHDYA